MGPIQRFTENQNTGADFIKKKNEFNDDYDFFFHFPICLSKKIKII